MAEYNQRPPKIKLLIHELKNAGGDGSAKSLVLGAFILTTLCGTGFGALFYVLNNPQISSALGIR